MTALDDLLRLVPPPDLGPAVDWVTVEATLGRHLPADYRGLVEAYGLGQFDQFLTVYQPVTPFLTVQLAFQAAQRGTGTLLPVAGTDNGDYLYWVTDPIDDPDAWTITGSDARTPDRHPFAGGITAFLHAVLSGGLRFPIFGQGFPSGPTPGFQPLRNPDPHRVAGLRAQGLYRDLE